MYLQNSDYCKVVWPSRYEKRLSSYVYIPLQGWDSMTMAFTGKFVYMAHYFILLRLNPFGLSVDRE